MRCNDRKDVFAAIALAAGTVATVVCQNLRLTVLWDASWILESATRIALGDVPYRDFPFPYAPLMYLWQALIIRIFGRAWWHYVAWAVIAGGAATAIAFGIARRLTSGAIAFFVALPLVLLGIYCIFPHPFYDPDACFVLLIVIALLLAADDRGWPRNATIAAGAACVIPLFVKQNIGLAFLGAVVLCAIAMKRWWLLAGVGAGLAVALSIVAIVFGAGNYYHWTIAYAAAKRLPPIAQQLAIYNDSDLWWWLGCVVVGGFIAMRRALPGVILVVAPLVWSVWRVCVTDDPNEPEINFLRLWPLMLVVSVVVAIATWRRERGFVRLLPLLIVATVHGVFLSQSTWGSTYGIWPLLILLVALAVRPLPRAAAIPIAIVFAATTLQAAWPYIHDEHRLTYAKWNEGAMATPTLPPLRGMRMRGTFLPDFEELVAFTDRVIPRDDAILCLPGEDLFYFTTGRRPRFPVLMFDRVLNPYDPPTLARLVAAHHVKWVIVKRRLQLNGTPMPEMGEVLRLLTSEVPCAWCRVPANARDAAHGTRHFVLLARLRNYDIYTNGGP